MREKGRGRGWGAGLVSCPEHPMGSRLEVWVGEEYPRGLCPSFCPLLAAPRPFGHCPHCPHPPLVLTWSCRTWAPKGHTPCTPFQVGR